MAAFEKAVVKNFLGEVLKVPGAAFHLVSLTVDNNLSVTQISPCLQEKHIE